ncbi:MAG: Gfo/Idh/MocA family oxidoreductase [Candidatus Hydrogenedentes bacterium]|nr:Gfo/Idh/MocA family oxidoreductase [Candidatus Hydrogenedentota bacterium]
MLNKSTSRRQFLKRTAVTAPLILSAKTWASPPSERLTIGVVGIGKMGGNHCDYLQGRDDVQIVALCDVESRRFEVGRYLIDEAYASRIGKGKYASVEKYGDFRAIAERNDIDAVLIAVPDHWHLLVSLAMVRSGKDVYCEKPLTLTIGEGRILVNEVRKRARVFQTGSQQRSEGGFRIACELVRNGKIGEVKEIHVSVGGPSEECYLPPMPAPEGLDWDFWLGPAPYRPYNSEFAPSLQPGPIGSWEDFNRLIGGYPNFRGYKDYSGGGMTDWGAHHFDIAQWGLGMDESGPVEIAPPNGSDVPHLTYRYANGVIMQRRDAGKAGVLFIGTEGKIMVNRGYLDAEPAGLLREQLRPGDIRLHNSRGHHEDWFDAIRTRSKPICDVEIGHRSCTVCHVGNIASWLNRPVKWDPQSECFINDDEANRLINRPMRAPWTLA